MASVITIDLEEWFHGLEPNRNNWLSLKRRAQLSTNDLLALFKEKKVKATFFVLGDVAENCPGLIETILKEGHEIGSHGMYHQFVYNQDIKEFRGELRKSLNLLKSITGEQIISFRAPFFSITKDSLWALDILRDEGIKYDSSVFPIYNYRYGLPDSPRLPYEIVPGLLECPVSTLPTKLCNIPFSGGFYFRFWPVPFTKLALKVMAKRNEPVIFYFHPWEFDPDQPRYRSHSKFNDIRHYYNLKNNLKRLAKILDIESFTTLKDGFSDAA